MDIGQVLNSPWHRKQGLWSVIKEQFVCSPGMWTLGELVSYTECLLFYFTRLVFFNCWISSTSALFSRKAHELWHIWNVAYTTVYTS